MDWEVCLNNIFKSLDSCSNWVEQQVYYTCTDYTYYTMLELVIAFAFINIPELACTIIEVIVYSP